MDKLSEDGKPFIADSILDPIHFGFTESILRYYKMRERFPDCEIMMGVGNLTELTEADTSGINAILFGIISELEIDNVLTTQVSPHACSAIREAISTVTSTVVHLSAILKHPRTHESVRNNAGLEFSRDSLRIERGDTVRFINRDSRKHAIYSLSQGQIFALGIQQPGDIAEVTFNHTGTIDVRSAAYFKQMSLKIRCD